MTEFRGFAKCAIAVSPTEEETDMAFTNNSPIMLRTIQGTSTPSIERAPVMAPSPIPKFAPW